MNQDDWIYVVPFTDCPWSEITRSVHEAFHRLAIERGWDKDYTGIFAKNLQRRRMALSRRNGKVEQVQKNSRREGTREKELTLARMTAAKVLQRLGTATVAELYEKERAFSMVSWRQWCVVAVRNGMAVYHPGRTAKEDRYEWKGTNETNPNSSPIG